MSRAEVDWNEQHPDWQYIIHVGKDFGRTSDELVQAQQVFHRVARWLGNLMSPDRAREFMMCIVDPDPIVDWHTGAELGDICPEHDKPYTCIDWYEGGGLEQLRLMCIDCL